MSDREKLVEEVAAISARFNAVKDELNAAQQRLAEASSQFIVGDIVKEQRRGYFFVIDKIKMGYFNIPELYGRRLKTDGTPYKRTNRIWSSQSNSLIKAEFPKK